ncbi:MAG: FAD:protein FMN transferase [Desulfobacteraceae bacterium]|nr:FAD:protein FMN transferase [Desulfobacteraceae bacterium]
MKNNLTNSDAFSKPITVIFLLFFVFLFAGCGLKKEVEFSGKTMGTTYHIKAVVGLFTNTKNIKDQIDTRLDEINKSMSTFRKESEISRFNAHQTVGEKFKISEDFYNVMIVAMAIYQETGGAWDGTVKPLVDLWGFGKSENNYTIPEKSRIAAILSNIGFNNIEIFAGHYLAKKNTAITLDLASIAKGYGVDQIAALIRGNGIDNFLVEIGGEVFAAGLRKDGKNWRIGINRPQKNAPVDQVYKVVNLQDKGFATSGDYRNYFEVNQKRFTHVIDPRNGYPVDNGVVSVSIIANTCTFADGLATAVMVLGHKKGLDLVNRLDNTECFIVTKKEDGALIDHYSKGFKIRK